MEPIDTLIIDDDPISRVRMRRLLMLDSDIRIAGEVYHGADAVEYLRGHSPRLIFMDANMPGVDGFGILQTLDRERFPVVVFVSAFDHFAAKAFEARAFDYLLKPFGRERFNDVLQRAKVQIELTRRVESGANSASTPQVPTSRRHDASRIAVRVDGQIVLLRFDSIDWVEAADNYVCIHAKTQGREQTYVVRETMNSFEQKLDGAQFLRIHRSTIINLDRVKEMHPSERGDYQVTLEDGTQLTLSRSHRDKVRGMLQKAF